MFVAVLTVVGMLISDLLLAWLDPRIRLGRRATMNATRIAPRQRALRRPARRSIPAPTEPIGAESEALLPRLVVAADVVEVPAPQGGGRRGLILLAFYLVVPFVEVIAPYNQTKRHGDFLYAPPQARPPVP